MVSFPRSTSLAALAILSGSLALPGATSAAHAQSVTPVISVTGEATVSVAPDTAEIDGGVTSEARTAREAADANNKAMGAVLLALKASGLTEKDFQTSRLSLQPQSAPNRAANAPAQIMSYRATNHVTVTLHDVSKTAATIDTLVGAGANEIGGINFSVSQASKLLDDARTQAVADALRKAEIYAKAANVTLGPALSISEEGASGPVPVYARKMSAGIAPAAIAPGEETLRINISVTYAIKQP